ncbi:MAG: hypothetical protein J6V89_01620, partial [Acetobacter sp.]|nr:hypothetical protein [Acetobacter sp.]
PAPQPTAETCTNNYILNTNAHQAMFDFLQIYEYKPAVLAAKLSLHIPYQPDLLEKFLNIRTLQGLQNFQQQLQKEHLLTDGALPSAPPPPPPAPPPINWAQYKITFSSIFVGAIERVLDPSLIKTSVRKLEQQLQGVHQQLQRLYQLSQQLHQGSQTIGSYGTPQEILNTVESIRAPGLSGVINYQKAVIASQNGNFMPLIAIYSQIQPQTWRNYFVSCYQETQQAHLKAKAYMH